MTAFGIGAIGLWVWGVPRLRAIWDNDIRFVDIPRAPGFQMLETDLVTGLSGAVFAGLDTPDPIITAALEDVRARPCHALYRGSTATVPIALFSDFNCPNCPQMDANVTSVVAQTPQTALVYHQLPLLGRTSVIASQAVLAAAEQDKYGEMHDALLRTPAVTDLSLVRRFAEQAGLDVDRFERTMNAPDIQGSLSISRALSQYLGLIGTPAAVIGRTVVLGIQSKATITAIIAHEKQRGATCS